MLDGAGLDQTLDARGQLFPPERLGRSHELWLGLFATKHVIDGRMAAVFVHQVGVDVIFSAVIGFGITVVVGQSGWWGAAIVGAVVVLFAALAAGWGLWKEKKAKAAVEQQ